MVDQPNRFATRPLPRRKFLVGAGLAGLGLFSSGVFAGTGAPDAGLKPRRSAHRDRDLMNFGLNFEYLEVELYYRALGQTDALGDNIDGVGKLGQVIGGREIDFQDDAVRGYAEELAFDERGHALFFRQALGDARIARPTIDLENSFTTAARLAGIVGPAEEFDAFEDDISFLLAAFMLEDVCVTFLKGGAPLLYDRDVISAAGRILATEGYHAGMLRTALFARRDLMATPTLTVAQAVQKISDLRDLADGDGDLDQGIVGDGTADGDDAVSNIVPADANALAFGRTPRQVLNIAYLSPDNPAKGGFFPDGVNGAIS